jgi:hypothetical protein
MTSSPGKIGAPLAIAALVFLLAAAPAQAEDTPSWLAYTAAPKSVASKIKSPVKAEDAHSLADSEQVDTEHIFGFTMGSDI